VHEYFGIDSEIVWEIIAHDLPALTATLTTLLAQLLQHLPEPRAQMVRRYGLYSSRSRGTWIAKPWLVRLALTRILITYPCYYRQ
jgi:hypothetical protein